MAIKLNGNELPTEAAFVSDAVNRWLPIQWNYSSKSVTREIVKDVMAGAKMAYEELRKVYAAQESLPADFSDWVDQEAQIELWKNQDRADAFAASREAIS